MPDQKSAEPSAPVKPRRFFQIHLSTAVVLMFVAAGLLYLNLTPMPNGYLSHGVNGSGRPVSDTRAAAYGCPIPFFYLGTTTLYYSNYPKTVSEYRDISPGLLALNVLANSLLLAATGSACEFLLRRRERRQP
jgi:hypothetical protein